MFSVINACIFVEQYSEMSWMSVENKLQLPIMMKMATSTNLYFSRNWSVSIHSTIVLGVGCSHILHFISDNLTTIVFDLISELCAYVIFDKKYAQFSKPPCTLNDD